MEDKDKYYWTQYALDPSELDDLVNERLKEGWELYGTPFVATQAEKDTRFCQAMTRGGIGRTR
jgi:hypothetical protein